MEETYAGSIFSKIVIAIFILAVFDLMFINWWVLTRSNSAIDIPNLEGQVVQTAQESPFPTATPASVVGSADILEGTNPEPSASPLPSAKVEEEKVVVQTQYKEIFIPLGSGQTTSTTFADLAGAEVSIDTSKYGQIDYVLFEASVWVDGGNGRAWAQVKNVSDNNPFIESQISNPTSTPTLKSSGKVPISAGSKTYRVQAKTELEQYAAHIDNARLKIVLK